jgi:hypothetical protein
MRVGRTRPARFFYNIALTDYRILQAPAGHVFERLQRSQISGTAKSAAKLRIKP